MDKRELARRYAQAASKATGIPYRDVADDDCSLFEIDGSFTIDEDTIEVVRQTLDGPVTERTLGYVVNVAVTSGGTYWDPPDVDLVFVSQHEHLPQAIEAAFLAAVTDRLTNAMQAIGEEIAYAETMSLTDPATGRPAG